MSEIQLLPLTSADIPAVHEISVAAFRNDAHTLFKGWEKRGDIHDIGDEMSTPALQSFIDADARGKGTTLKAVVDGEIKGWVSWGFYNLSGELQRKPDDNVPLALDAPISHPDFPDDPSLPLIDQMGNLTSAHLFNIVERLNTPPNRVVYCRSICVHPSAQGQGVGSKLVQTAVDIADKHGASMWIHLSDEPAKGAMFKKFGFVEVNRLEVDLDKYRTKEVPKEKGDQWGTYTFRILRRPAKGEES